MAEMPVGFPRHDAAHFLTAGQSGATFTPSAIKPVSWKSNSLTWRSCCCVPKDSVGSKMCTSHGVMWTMSCSNSACMQTLI